MGGREEVTSNSWNAYHFLGMEIKEDLGSLASKTEWILRGMREKQANL